MGHPEKPARVSRTVELLRSQKSLALQVSQRPTFVIESAIGDKAVFSGLAVAEPLIATIEAMSRDEAGYAAHKAHFGGPPA